MLGLLAGLVTNELLRWMRWRGLGVEVQVRYSARRAWTIIREYAFIRDRAVVIA